MTKCVSSGFVPYPLTTSVLLSGSGFSYEAIRQTAATPARLSGYEAQVLKLLHQYLGSYELGQRTSASTGEPQLIVLKQLQLAAAAAPVS